MSNQKEYLKDHPYGKYYYSGIDKGKQSIMDVYDGKKVPTFKPKKNKREK